MPEARRTLVKSPPELWAEISDPDCLSKHLEAFGEIRITRVQPETTVAWEGDRARGTVELEASGWGTKVRLTAEVTEDVEEPEPAPPAPPPVAEEPEPEPVAQQPEPEPVAEEPEPEPEPEPTPPAASEEPPPEPAPIVAPAPLAAKRRGFFARMFGRKELPTIAEAEPLTPPAAPVIEEPPVAEEPRVAEEPPEPVAEEPPPEPDPSPTLAEDITAAEEEPPAEVRVTRLGEEEAAAVLDNVLDTLGSAHHRPFSR